MEGGSIGQYRILRKLGEGGMGTVWIGEHTLLGRRAAIKVLLPALSANQGMVQRFFNEARAVTAVADPGIVQVFDFGFDGSGSAYIVMELLEGEPMDVRLRRIGRFSTIDSLRLMRQVATSLAAAHGKGVIHRDLKPENLFIVGDPAVTGGERPKILDFGIAKLNSDEPGKFKTRTGVLMGTPVYMSPEQCRGTANIDHRSDVYALGCVLFTMLCGRPPFDGEGTGDIIIAHVRDAPPRPSSQVPGIPAELDALVLRCLEKDPANRFQSMAEMAQALHQIESALFAYPAGGYATPPPIGLLAATPTPMYGAAMTPPPPLAGAVTTLESASGQGGTTGIVQGGGRRRSVLVIGTIAALAIGGGALAVMRSGGDDGDGGGGTPGGNGAASAALAPDAGATSAATPMPDAAVLAAPLTEADASIPSVDLADAAPATAAAPVDAGADNNSRPRGGRGRRGRSDHGDNQGSGLSNRGD